MLFWHIFTKPKYYLAITYKAQMLFWHIFYKTQILFWHIFYKVQILFRQLLVKPNIVLATIHKAQILKSLTHGKYNYSKNTSLTKFINAHAYHMAKLFIFIGMTKPKEAQLQKPS